MADILELFACGDNEQGGVNFTMEEMFPDFPFLEAETVDDNNHTLGAVIPLRDPTQGLCNLSFWEFEEVTGKDPYKRLMNDLNIYFTPVIILVGTAGNLLSFLVFTATHLKRQSSSVYLASLAIVDIMFLLSLSIIWLSWIKVNLFHRFIWCQVVVYLTYVTNFLSTWYVVSFTIERYIIVWYPLRKDRLCSRKRARRVVGSLAVIGLLLYLFANFTNGIIYIATLPVCMPLPHHYSFVTVATALDFFFTLVIPSVIIVILNVRIIVKIMEYPRHRTFNDTTNTVLKSEKSEVSTSNKSEDANKTTTTCKQTVNSVRTCVYIQKGSLHAGRSNSSTRPIVRTCSPSAQKHTHIRIAHGRTRAQYRTARMLIIVSTVFVILNLPSHVFRINAFVQSSVDARYMTTRRALRWQELFQLLCHLNFSINFFLYSVYGRQFRTGLKILYTRGTHKMRAIQEHFAGITLCKISKKNRMSFGGDVPGRMVDARLPVDELNCTYQARLKNQT